MRIKTFEEYKKAYYESINNPESFWGKIAENFIWYRKWNKVITGDFENVNFRWFVGAQTNIIENAITRHINKYGNKPAIIWEPNDPSEDNRIITYSELDKEVSKFANALKSLGVKKGDRVGIYMPMVPEAAISMLACAKIGAIHSVVFAGFSANALAERLNDAQAKILITANGMIRGTKFIPLKEIADNALKQNTSVEKVIVFKRLENIDFPWNKEKDIWWHSLVEDASDECANEIMDANDPLFILYTSGSTGKPKGILHGTGGYMVYAAYTFLNVFQYNEGDIFWCSADVGWITGHTYVLYGALLNSATTLMFEGTPMYPTPARFWNVIDKHKVNIFYTAPTAIRALMAKGDKWLENVSLDSLRVLGSVGEPINEEAWQWFYEKVGKNKCPIVDTWWQTETGGIMISPLAGITPLRPTYATLPLPGIVPVILDEKGNELQPKDTPVEGYLCIKHSWPGQSLTMWGNHKRFIETYFSQFKGYYFTGDGALMEPDKYIRIIGRVDDVVNVSGHRIGTAELEDVINKHPLVVESAVIGAPHPIKGEQLYAFVIPVQDINISDEELEKQIKQLVSEKLGAFARPEHVQIVPNLPKTRSGKIMRRILRKLLRKEFDNLGDTSTLLNPEIVEEIKDGLKI